MCCPAHVSRGGLGAGLPTGAGGSAQGWGVMGPCVWKMFTCGGSKELGTRGEDHTGAEEDEEDEIGRASCRERV